MMTPHEAARELAMLQAQYDLLVSGQAPSEVVADGYSVKNSRADLPRLKARIAELEALARGRRGLAIGIRF